MTTLTDYRVIDGVDDVLAAQYNRVIDSIVRGELSNTETLSANKTLSLTDFPLQVLTPTAARDVTLPTVGATNHPYYIVNASASYALTVKNAGGTTIGIVPVSSAAMFVSNGTAWYMQNMPYTAPGTSGNVLTSNGSSWISSPAAGGSNSICDGRLTLTSGTPVTTADVVSSTNVYYTPYIGNKIALYDGSATWNVRSFTEITLAIGTVTAALPYDVFAYDNSGTVALEKLAWTNGTTRATALTFQNGVLVKSGATTRRYLGTFYTISTTATADTETKRFLWNYYNRAIRYFQVTESTVSWSYSVVNTIRQANNNTSNKIEIVTGVAEDAIDINVLASCINTGANVGYAFVGIGEDTTTTMTTTGYYQGVGSNPNLGAWFVLSANLTKIPAVGYHYYSWNEKINSSLGTTITFAGDQRAGIHGKLRG